MYILINFDRAQIELSQYRSTEFPSTIFKLNQTKNALYNPIHGYHDMRTNIQNNKK